METSYGDEIPAQGRRWRTRDYSFREVGVALPELVEQPGVLDGDCRLRSLRVRGFATCTGPPSHCRPSAQDKASWRGQPSTRGDGSSQGGWEMTRAGSR